MLHRSFCEGELMGLAYAEIELFNPSADELKPIVVTALVDSGSTRLVVPQHVANQLKLPVLEQREVTLEDGATKVVDYAGPIRLRFDNRNAFTGALVMGDEVLLGAIPMEDMDLIIHPLRRLLMANPQNPNIPGAMAVGVQPTKRDENA
jgi:clan AA aspartic protease